MFLTLPTSTPAIRTKLPFSRPVTLVNSARYSVDESNRSWPNTATIAAIATRQTPANTANRHSGPHTLLVMVAAPGAAVGPERAGQAHLGRMAAGVPAPRAPEAAALPAAAVPTTVRRPDR